MSRLLLRSPSLFLPQATAGGGGGASVDTISGTDISLINLVHWWPFDGDATDISDNGWDATLSGSPSYVSGPTAGDAVQLLQASSQYASRADASDYDANSGGWSLACWFKPIDLSTNHIILAQKYDGTNGWVLYWSISGGGYWSYRANSTFSSDPSDSGADVTLDQWDHFVFTRANATANIKVYRNGGTPVSLSHSTSPISNTAAFEIGRFNTAFRNDVTTAEYSFWKRELSAAEVAVLYNSGVRATLTSPTMSGTSLAHWLPFNGDALDDSGNSRDFTLQNSPSYITGPGGIGQAVEFNSASSEYCLRADEPSYDATGAWSMSAWVRSNDLSQDTGLLQKITGSTGHITYWESVGYWRTTFDTTSSGNPSDSGADFPATDTWIHITVTRANATADLKVYKNGGTPVTISQSVTPTENTADAEIGRKFTTQAEIDIAEHTFWTRELSADDVAVLYNSGKRLTHSEITFS